jgi:aldose 1-epimerase
MASISQDKHGSNDGENDGDDGNAVCVYTLRHVHTDTTVRISTLGATIISLTARDRDGRSANVVAGYGSLEAYKDGTAYFGAVIGRVCNRIKDAKFTLPKDGCENSNDGGDGGGEHGNNDDGGNVSVNKRSFTLAANNGVNHLHGGDHGFDKRVWNVTSADVVADDDNDDDDIGDSGGGSCGGAAVLSLRLVSADGDGGYPGEVIATCTYTLTTRRVDNDIAAVLRVRLTATTSRLTPVAMTAHSYFNLSGDCAGACVNENDSNKDDGGDDAVTDVAVGSTEVKPKVVRVGLRIAKATILDHHLCIASKAYTPIDVGGVPTGEVASSLSTPFDFRQPTRICERLADGCAEGVFGNEQLQRGNGFDHNFVIDTTLSSSSSSLSNSLPLVASLSHAASGRCLRLFSNQPGLQVYTHNWPAADTDANAGADKDADADADSGDANVNTGVFVCGRRFVKHSHIALEPQAFPNAVNESAFPSIWLAPGDLYENNIEYELSTMANR